MKKAGLLILTLVTTLVFSTKAFAAPICITLARYNADGLSDVTGIQDVSIWTEYSLSATANIGSSIAPIDIEFENIGNSWVFCASVDLPALEIYSKAGQEVYYFVPGWEPYADIDPALPASYFHLSDGMIPAGTYFGLMDTTAWAAVDPTDLYIHATPIPSAVWLLGSGLIGLVALRRKSS